MPVEEGGRTVWGVGELLDLATAVLAEEVGTVWVDAEVKGYRGPHQSGHHYFSLEDAEGAVPAIVWRSTARSLGAPLEEGARLLVRGRLDVWKKTGKLSLIVDRVEPRGGLGELARRFEELKRRLREEGLFAAERKRPLPPRPRRVVVVTGRGSAAEGDVLDTLRRLRVPAWILVRHSRVQGEGAAAELAAALDAAARIGADVVLLARGGGSLQDLWAFNEEPLVRAVAASPVPVVCAVGHETDFTLCDFAADERAITPTAGARRVVEGWVAARDEVADLGGRLASAVAGLLGERSATLQPLAPALTRGVERRLETARLRLDRAMRKVLHQRPERRLERRRAALAECERRFLDAGAALGARRRRALARRGEALRRLPLHRRLPALRERLHALDERLEAGNPEALLRRGYALVEAEGRSGFLRRAAEVAPGARIRVRLAEGALRARVEEVESGAGAPPPDG